MNQIRLDVVQWSVIDDERKLLVPVLARRIRVGHGVSAKVPPLKPRLRIGGTRRGPVQMLFGWLMRLLVWVAVGLLGRRRVLLWFIGQFAFVELGR